MRWTQVCTRCAASASTGRSVRSGWPTDGGRTTLRERLERVQLARPRCGARQVEEALWQHLSAVGAETDDFEWASDLEDGFERVRERLLADHIVWAPSGSPHSWGRFSLWTPDAEVSYPDRRLERREDPFVAPAVRVARASLGRRWRVHRTSRTYRRWRQSYAAGARPGQRLPARARRRRRAGDRPRRQAHARAVPRASRATRATGRPRRGRSHEWKQELRTFESARYRAPVLEPLARAWIDGLYCFWVTESPRWRQRHCILVPRPALHVADGRLHRPDGPAVEWPSGLSYWFWEGLHIPRRIAAKDSERARLQVLVRTPNLERRRLLLDRIGYERFLDITDAKLVQQDDYGKLWRTALSVDGEQLTRRRGRQLDTRARRQPPPLLPARPTRTPNRAGGGRLDVRLRRRTASTPSQPNLEIGSDQLRGGAVESRTISFVASSTRIASIGCCSSRRVSRLTAIRPISARG